MVKIVILIFVTYTSSLALANSETAFDAFKSFNGKWSIQSDGKLLPIEMTYDNGSKNSIVAEQFGKELSVFYRDGQDLLMTHFCNVGNQPRLKLKGDSKIGYLEFVTFDVTNLENQETPHVQKVVYHIINEKHIELELVWKLGKSERSEKYILNKK
jgi:hypothetical protein